MRKIIFVLVVACILSLMVWTTTFTGCCSLPWIDCDKTPTPVPTKTPTPEPTVTPTPTPWVPKTVLTVKDRSFYINGKKTFLIGFSYYGGLGASVDQMKIDINYMKNKGFNWFRLWSMWNRCLQNASIVDLHGEWVPDVYSKFVAMMNFCDKNGIIIDVTGHFCNKNFSNCCNAQDRTCDGPFSDCAKPSEPCRTIADLKKFWQNMAKLCKPWRNLYFDIANEHDVQDARHVNSKDVQKIRNAIKAIDPDRLVTCSGAQTYQANAEHLDFMAPHLARGHEPWKKTCPWLQLHGPKFNDGPVQLQEPFRNGYGSDMYEWWEFCEDLKRAINCSFPAAGWCFHNDAAYDLKNNKFIDELDPEEKKFIRRLSECM